IADREYHIQTGIIGSRCFLTVDDVVIVEMCDPEPISHPTCNRVGLGVYCSQARFRDFKLLKPYFKHTKMSYSQPEF
ncbi:MAG: hypothetical protein RR977_02720, partial [Oscillospiraceae bacterium]